nr:MAG TPA: hypothetical protein [Caudoviricetes sp.]
MIYSRKVILHSLTSVLYILSYPQINNHLYNKYNQHNKVYFYKKFLQNLKFDRSDHQ